MGGVIPGQSVFDDLVPEVKCFSEEVLEVRTPRLVQSSVQRSHAVYCPYGLPDAAGHQTLLDCGTAGTQHFTHYCFCQPRADTGREIILMQVWEKHCQEGWRNNAEATNNEFPPILCHQRPTSGTNSILSPATAPSTSLQFSGHHQFFSIASVLYKCSA